MNNNVYCESYMDSEAKIRDREFKEFLIEEDLNNLPTHVLGLLRLGYDTMKLREAGL